LELIWLIVSFSGNDFILSLSSIARSIISDIRQSGVGDGINLLLLHRTVWNGLECHWGVP
jgi:hypothetical protein